MKIKRLIKIAIVFIIISVIYILIVNKYVEYSGSKYIKNPTSTPKADAIIILGAYVYPDGRLSPMLYDRLFVGNELYDMGKAKKIIVSGDHGQKNYDEVNAMKDFLKKRGIATQDIFMDHAGFSTYDSLYRARDIFNVKKIIIVTQEYHLKRAVFIARELGLEAYGIASDKHDYGSIMTKYKIREIAARNKDFLLTKILKPEPTFLGEEIPIQGDGRTTDDK